MAAPHIKKRKRYFIAVEGESEQSLVKWIQQLSEQKGLHIHLDCHLLGGGGYITMIKAAGARMKKGLCKGSYECHFLIVDSDRSEAGDLPIDQLRHHAKNESLTVCVQVPNMEGLLYRMMPDKERAILTAAEIQRQLSTLWPEYKKPADANMLAAKFSLNDLLRVAQVEPDLQYFLSTINLIKS